MNSDNLPLPTLQSNNPFRFSIMNTNDGHSSTVADPVEPSTRTLPSPSPMANTNKSKYSTIVESDKEDAVGHGPSPNELKGSTEHDGKKPEDHSLPSAPEPVLVSTKKKDSVNDGIFITIQPGSTASLDKAEQGGITHRFSVECCEESTMWPARRWMQKSRLKNKRVRIALKVLIALIIIVGAVAVGLGISRAVRAGKS